MNGRENVGDVRGYYDSRVPSLEQPYRRYRWGSSPIRREHFAQTCDRLLSELSKHRFDRAVEVGCGPLVWTPLLAARTRHLFALDLSLAMLTEKGIEADAASASRCCADAERLPLSDGSVEAVCTIRAFEYFPDKRAVVREFARVIARGGYLMIVTKNREYGGYGSADDGSSTDTAKALLHSGKESAAALAQMLAEAGFTDAIVRPVIIGRTRFVPIWKVLRLVGRLGVLRWRRGIPRWATGAVESFMITACRS